MPEQVEEPRPAPEEWTKARTGGGRAGALPIAQFRIQQACGEEVCLPRHRAMPLTATPGGESREKSPGAQKGGGVCRSITGHDCVTNNHSSSDYKRFKMQICPKQKEARV